jgi:hypothetical protein
VQTAHVAAKVDVAGPNHVRRSRNLSSHSGHFKARQLNWPTLPVKLQLTTAITIPGERCNRGHGKPFLVNPTLEY